MRIIGNDPNTPRQTQVVASGTLSTGDTVVVNSDGTVSAVAGSSEAIGSTTTFNSGITDEPVSVYDANSGKIVVAYRDESNGDYLTAIVGTVSGTSISFGTEVVAHSVAVSFLAICYDSNSNKVVIAYKDQGGSNYGNAIVGTVSGTSISFGSSAVFNTNGSEYMAATFDSNSNKVVISYSDQGNSNYGTAIVGTVSGTSISFGTSVVFESSDGIFISSAFDTNSNKVVIFYRDQGNSFQGTGIVGTVSGTSISFGTAVAFSGGNKANRTACAFDSSSNKIVVSYHDASSSQGKAVVATVSGTSISFGTSVVFENANIQNSVVGYSSSANQIVIAYRDNGNSNYGTLITASVSGTSVSFDSPTVFETATTDPQGFPYDTANEKLVLTFRGTSDYGRALVFQSGFTNLTAENYIGIAKSGAADGDGVVVNTQGNVDTGQTGLTAGQSYYVQTDGTLSTTAGDPSVFAGTAVSATKLIVKG